MKKNFKNKYILLIIALSLVSLSAGNNIEAFEGVDLIQGTNKNYKQPLSNLANYFNNFSLGVNNFITEIKPVSLNNLFNQDVNVTTLGTSDVDEDSATLKGQIKIKNSDSVDVWFEYGKDPGNLKYSTSKDELSSDETYEDDISDLEDDQIYFFRMVAEDEDGEKYYGNTLSFVTDDDEEDDEIPDVETDSATSITEDEAKLKGYVDMNDFEDGIVFFVYGTDKDVVEDVADNYDTYSSIDDDFEKTKVSSNFDKSGSFSLKLKNLDDDTKYYYSICVQYENEDGDDEIISGGVKYFTTDED